MVIIPAPLTLGDPEQVKLAGVRQARVLRQRRRGSRIRITARFMLLAASLYANVDAT